ncbi:hypothetical protein Bca52824_046339 [Brassica carinata]|uniref:Secreted protein n=1 Tax=Brassica carinata TaxID=52824 RepID=A0A8X7RH33_BRACI|nr:hypothetical protein Bca52824_046339 [Brassica carinata]
MSCLLILVSIALAITFSNHSSEAANLPLTITDIVLCNNNNILRSGTTTQNDFSMKKLIFFFCSETFVVLCVDLCRIIWQA